MIPSRIALAALGLHAVLAAPAAAYDVETHRELSVKAATASRLAEVLREDLGLRGPNGPSVLDRAPEIWVSEGGGLEDRPDFRVRNHFHNPLRAWSDAGLRVGVQLGQSSVLWSQDPEQDVATDGLGGGTWSWPATRQRYRIALTAEAPAERDAHLARTLRGLGHLMHLVQDASVPAHVRNDAHLLLVDPDPYEDWVGDTRKQDAALFQALTGAVVTPPASLFAPTLEPRAAVPVAGLIDGRTFLGRNVDALDGPSLGIAEYTSGNFVSKDTRFTSEFAWPRMPDLEVQLLEQERGRFRRYFRKDRDGARVEHFVAEGMLFGAIQDTLGRPLPESFVLSGRVHQDYAALLLPRAIGHSAALLDYFFRGRLDVELAEDDASPSGFVLRGSNASAEALGEGGRLTVYADDASGVRRPASDPAARLDVAVPPGAALPPVPLTSIPSDAERFVAVYEGTLGGEAATADEAGFGGAVIGRVLGGTRVEEVFTDGETWRIRTPRGVFTLPLSRREFERVQWADGDDLLVARTAFGPGEPNLVAAYEVQREPRSAAPKTTPGPVGATVELRLLREAVFPFDLPLGTEVDFGQSVAYRQQLTRVERTVNTVWDGTSHYEFVGAEFTTPVVETAIDTEVTFGTQFPVVLDVAHLFPDSAPPYGWELVDIGADRSGRLLGLVAVYLTDPGLEPVMFPKHFVDPEGALRPTVFTTSVAARFPDGLSPLWALVDIAAGRVVATTAEPRVTITLRESRTDGPLTIPPYGLGIYVRERLVRLGGDAAGIVQYGWSPLPFLPPGTPKDFLTEIAVTAGVERLQVEGWRRPELREALAAAGFADFTLAPAEAILEFPYGCEQLAPRPSRCHAIRTVGGGLQVARTPASLDDGRRSRPSSSGERVVFLATDYTPPGAALAAVVAWDPTSARAEARYRPRSVSGRDAYALTAATGSTALVVTENFEVLDGDPILSTALVPLDGPAPATVFGDVDLSESFTLLDPGYLYNVQDLRFYRPRPPLAPTALPARLVDVPGNPVGDYHAIMLP